MSSIVVELGDKEILVNHNCSEELRSKISDSVVTTWETGVLIPWSENSKEKIWVLKVKDLICGINTKRRLQTMAAVVDTLTSAGHKLCSTFSRQDGTHTLIFTK